MRIMPGLVNAIAHRRQGLGMLTGAVLAGVAVLAPGDKAKAQDILCDALTISQNLADRVQGDNMINTPRELIRILENKVRAGDSFVKKISKGPGDMAKYEYEVTIPHGKCTFSFIRPDGAGSIIAYNAYTKSSGGQTFDNEGQLSDRYSINHPPESPKINIATPDVYPELDSLLNRCIQVAFEESA